MFSHSFSGLLFADSEEHLTKNWLKRHNISEGRICLSSHEVKALMTAVETNSSAESDPTSEDQ